MIVSSRVRARRIAIADFPEAVGPQMTGIRAPTRPSLPSASPEAALELIPGQLNDGLPAVHVMRGKPAAMQRHEQGTHLRERQCITGLDRRLARNRGRETLMPRRGGAAAIAGERRKGVAQASLSVEARMRRGHGVDDERLSTEIADLVAERLQQVAMRVERLRFRRRELQREGKQQPLRGTRAAVESIHEL